MARGKIAAKVGRAACPHAAEGGVLAPKTTKAMKPSGVAWLGDIPEGWEVDKAKRFFRQTNTRGNATPTLLAATQKYGMYPQDRLEGVVKVKEETDLQLFKTVHIDDFVISLRSFQGGFAHSSYEGVCSPAYQTFHATKVIWPRFYSYLFKSGNFIQMINSLTVGIREGKNINYCDFAECLMINPPLPEQRTIADYLDEKCAAIDAAIAEAKKGIEEYKAWKKSLIFEAVNGDWEKRRLRFLADITTGNKDTQDAEPDGAYPFYVRSPIVERSTDYTFEGPGIMMAGDGAGAGRVFHYAVGKYAVHQRVYRIYNFRGIEGRFLLYSLGAIFPLEMDKGSAQSTVPSVRLPMLKDLLIPLPPLAEQLAIVDHLDEKCAAIDAMVTEKESLIADLEAYKKSLIYEVVTGKREVA